MRNKRGFTLVEVLAAITLVAIVIPVAMHGVSLAANLGDLARRKTEASFLAKSKLDELIVTGGWYTGSLNGTCGTGYADYNWKASVTDWNEDSDVTTFRQVEVRVFWTSRGKGHDVAVSTLVEAQSQ